MKIEEKSLGRFFQIKFSIKLYFFLFFFDNINIKKTDYYILETGK